MDKKEYEELFNNINSCIAIYEAADNGNDFIIRDFNKAAENADKIKREDIIGKSVLKVFPGVKDFGLFDVFKRVYKTGKPENLPISIYGDNRLSVWRENFVYKTSKGEIVAIYTDATAKKQAEEEIKSLAKFPEENPNPVGRIDYDGKLLITNEPTEILCVSRDVSDKIEEEDLFKKMVLFAEELLKTGTKQVTYQKILENLLCISKAKYGALTLLSESTGKFTTIEVAGMTDKAKKVGKMLGFELIGKEWNEYSTENEKLQGQVVSRFSSMTELAGRVIPKMISGPIEKFLNIGEVTVTKVIVNNQMIGDITLIMPAGRHLQNDYLVEIYSRQIDMFITRIKAEDKLKESEEKYRSIIESSSDAIFCVDEKGQYKFTNHLFSSTFGKTPDYFIGKTFWDIYPKEHADYRYDATKRVFQTGESESLEVEVPLPDKTLYFLATANPIKDDTGKVILVLSHAVDITERKRSEELMQKSEVKYRQLFDNMTTGFALHEMIYDEEGNPVDYRFLEVNSAFEKLTGLKASLLIGKTVKDVIPGTEQYWIDTYSIVAKTGESISFQNYAEGLKKWYESWVFSPSKNKFATIFSDITERKKAEQEILKISFHDHLTGLYNRRFFEEELKRLDTQRQLPLSFIMGDLNGLKVINDVFGHAEGDRLLGETAEILKTVCRSDDILARWGGDEFVILLPKTSISEAEEIAGRIKKECKKTNNQKIALSLSLGAATKEVAGQNIQTILIDVESNMYRNKLGEKQSLASSVIFALDQALYEKSNETKEHTDRIHELALKLGKSSKLPSHQLDELALLASLHDIGKVAIPEKILLKKSKLTEKEWSIIKRHPEIGFNIAQSSPQIAHISKSILSCHENWDGSGYPLGIKGHAIPIISRIILIVDAYDVMTSGRIYKLPMSRDDAIGELKRCAGSQFDPVLVNKFIEILAN